jgi:transposase
MQNGEKTVYRKLKRLEVLSFFENLKDKETIKIGLEACGGCHYWARNLEEMGFCVKMLKPTDVKPYAKSKQKNDKNDALAIAKATLDTELKAVAIKSIKAQEIMILHKIRENTIQSRIEKCNRFIAFLHEFGYVPTRNSKSISYLKQYLEDAFDNKYITENIKNDLKNELLEIENLLTKEKDCDKKIADENKNCPKAKRFGTIMGIGNINASTLGVTAMESYPTGRDFAASLGLVPKQNSTGGNVILGSITKTGDRYVRKMLVQGARTILIKALILQKKAEKTTEPVIEFAIKLLEKKSFNTAAVAVANKLARIAWSMNNKGRNYGEYA